VRRPAATAALVALASLAAACGGDAAPEPGPSPVDARIVDLVETRGAALDRAWPRFLAGAAELDAAGLRRAAPARARTAARMLRDAEAAAAALAPLAPRATLAGEVASAGAAAFEGFAGCARDGAALWRAAGRGEPAGGLLDRATVSCTAARGALEAADGEIAALPAP
jgi:hypothetical protein